MDKKLLQTLEQEARRIEVWMPNMERPDEIKEFAGKVVAFLNKNAVSRRELAAAIGISQAALSQFLSDKYPGDCKKLVTRLADYINRYARRSGRQKEAAFVETTVARAIFSVIRQTESFTQPGEGRIAVIIGDAGHGKTLCLQQYAKVHPAAVYAKLNDTMSSAALFSAIAGAMELDPSGGLKVLTGRIAEALARRERTVLLDECSGLNIHKLNQLRQIIGESGSTLILAGNNQLLKTISSDAARRGNESLDQFRSRMLAVLDLDAAAGSGHSGGGRGGELYTADDIRKLYEYGIKIDKSGLILIKKICSAPQTGRLRTVSIVVSAINSSRQGREGKIKQIDAAVIESVIRSLGLPIADKLPLLTQRPAAEEPDVSAKTA